TVVRYDGVPSGHVHDILEGDGFAGLDLKVRGLDVAVVQADLSAVSAGPSSVCEEKQREGDPRHEGDAAQTLHRYSSAVCMPFAASSVKVRSVREACSALPIHSRRLWLARASFPPDLVQDRSVEGWAENALCNRVSRPSRKGPYPQIDSLYKTRC